MTKEAAMRKALVAATIASLISTPMLADRLTDPQWSAEQEKTVNDLRDVGTCLVAWWLENLQPQRTVAEASPEVVTLSAAPLVSWQELADLLVPFCLSELPALDGWGHPYEYRLSRDPNAALAIALRSGGSDGRFSGSDYTIGSVPADAEEGDLVWADGYFVQHPARADQ